jgi:hypothetical protein
MTTEMMNLRSPVEKTPDADLLREMIAFAAERLMEIEVGALTGAAHGEKRAARLVQRTAIANATGRRGSARLSCASPSRARAATFPGSSSRAGWPRRSLGLARQVALPAPSPSIRISSSSTSRLLRWMKPLPPACA